MAIKLTACYCKRLGLPGYSSHQFTVSVESELSSVNEVAQESSRLYEVLQSNVDEQIQQAGFVPDGAYPGSQFRTAPHHKNEWRCTGKQQELIARLVDEHHLEKSEVESLSKRLFRKKDVIFRRERVVWAAFVSAFRLKRASSIVQVTFPTPSAIERFLQTCYDFGQKKMANLS